MSAFRLAPSAHADLRGIKAWSLPRWGHGRCAQYLKDMRASFRRLAEYPMLGTACDNIRLGYRRLKVGEHYVYYRLEHEGVAIIRIRPQVMLPTEAMLDEKRDA